MALSIASASSATVFEYWSLAKDQAMKQRPQNRSSSGRRQSKMISLGRTIQLDDSS